MRHSITPAAKAASSSPKPTSVPDLNQDRVERELDEALRESFPASDPIAVNPEAQDDGLDEALDGSFPASDPASPPVPINISGVLRVFSGENTD